jgi:spermidine synthase
VGHDRAWHWFVDQISEGELHAYAYGRAVHFGRTEHQAVEIVDVPAYGKLLILDGKIQSGQLDEHIYHEALVHPALLAHPAPKAALILGGGEGATLREVLRHGTIRRAVMVDIDEEVVGLCRTYLPEWHRGAFDDPRAELVYADAAAYLDQAREAFDAIFVDITDPGVAGLGPEFFGRLAARLRPPGIAAVQGLELSLGAHAAHAALRRAAGAAFATVRSYAAYIPCFRAQWGFLTASPSLDPGALAPAEVAARLRERGLAGGPRFYDATSHAGLFGLARDLRALIGADGQ